MNQSETKINEIIVSGRKFRKLVDPVVKDWPRISGWVKIIDISEEEPAPMTSEIVKGRTFPNCNYKGRITEFKKQNKPFRKGTLISEDN